MKKTKKPLLMFLLVLIYGSVQAQQRHSFPSQNEWSSILFIIRTPDPGLADSVFSLCRKEDYSGIYHNSDKSLKTLQKEEAVIHFFSLLKGNCGALRSYEQKKYVVHRSKDSKPKFIIANYSLEFDSLHSDAVAVFQVKSRKKIRLSSLAVTLDSTVRIAMLDTVSQRTLGQLKNREYREIYDSASPEFRSLVPLEEVHKLFGERDTIDPEDFSLKISRIGFDQGNYLFAQTWTSESENYSLTFIYKRVQGVFRLNGLDYSFLNEHKP